MRITDEAKGKIISQVIAELSREIEAGEHQFTVDEQPAGLNLYLRVNAYIRFKPRVIEGPQA